MVIHCVSCEVVRIEKSGVTRDALWYVVCGEVAYDLVIVCSLCAVQR